MQDSLLKRFVSEPALLAEYVSGDFPPVLSLEVGDNEAALELDVTAGLAWFRGHFPGQPVLPGVVQLHWAAEIASVLFSLQGPPRHVKRLKFSNVVVPPRVIELRLEKHGDREIQFQVQGDGLQNSQGRLVYPEPRQ
jgi:3-hydroxymyristoyl/3-hydroxydecanoyl-(acyl carrier protein) dehydratase